jgi:hypothetical protein
VMLPDCQDLELRPLYEHLPKLKCVGSVVILPLVLIISCRHVVGSFVTSNQFRPPVGESQPEFATPTFIQALRILRGGKLSCACPSVAYTLLSECFCEASCLFGPGVT